jgi:hypothetical protein
VQTDLMRPVVPNPKEVVGFDEDDLQRRLTMCVLHPAQKSTPKPKAKAAAEGDAKPKKRVPWNKGLKHSEATKAKIRERTAAAMKRPEIIAKLQESGHKQRHSAETKAKISAKVSSREWRGLQ